VTAPTDRAASPREVVRARWYEGRMTRVRLSFLVAVALLAVSGCGQVYEQDVRAVARAFHDAYRSGDGAAACAELAPKTREELVQSAGTRCAQAVLEEDVPPVETPRRVRVFGTQAMVDFGEETTFLARFQSGWKVMAAGCTPVPGEPYDCAISGG